MLQAGGAGDYDKRQNYSYFQQFYLLFSHCRIEISVSFKFPGSIHIWLAWLPFLRDKEKPKLYLPQLHYRLTKHGATFSRGSSVSCSRSHNRCASLQRYSRPQWLHVSGRNHCEDQEALASFDLTATDAELPWPQCE
jgi:hypothetical protein